MPLFSTPERRSRSGRPARLLLAVAGIAAALAGPAQAADALRGKTLYNTTPGGISCANSSCHGTNVSLNRNKILRGANSPSTIQNAINGDTGGMGIYRNNVLTATDVADIAAYIGNPNVTAGAPVAAATPTALSFASTTVGSTTASQTVTLRNTGTAALSITAIAVSNASFVIASGGSCAAGGSVAAAGSCTINVQFRPQSTGTLSGSLTVTHNATPTTTTVALSGTATAAVTAQPAVTPSALNFGSVAVGSRSAVQTVTVSNSGSGPLSLGAITVSNARFAIAGGSCASGGTVAAGGGSCTVLVDFAPTVTGAASGNLSIAHNASASPLLVALSGTGAAPAAPVAQLSPTALSYSQVINTASANQTATLTNTGNAPLLIGSISLGGTAAADYTIAAGSSCTSGGTVAAGASCSLLVSFRPSATGTRTAAIAISHDDTAHSPSTLSLNGTGTAQPTGQLAVNRLALSYAAQPLGSSSAAQTVTVSNSGSAVLSLSTLAIGGAQSSDFAIVAGSAPCSVGGSLAVGASCTVDVLFTPTVASGTRSASLSLAAGTAGSATISLSGTAAAAAAPILSLTPTSLAFGSVATGSTSPAQTAQLANTGTASLAIASLTPTSARYLLSHDCPASLAVGSHCTLTLRFAPTVNGSVAGAIDIASNAASSPDALALSGTGVTPVPATLGWVGSSSLSFPDTATGAQSAALALSLHNSGTSPAALDAFAFSGAAAGDYRVDPSSSCSSGGSLAGGASCSLQIVFAPITAGARSASLGVTSSNATPPTAASLSGNGVAGGTPLMVLTPSAITLSSLPNEPLQPQVLVIGNQGAGPLQVTGEATSSDLALLDSASTGGGSCQPLPFTLAPGASCTLVVNPLASQVDGTVQISSGSDSQSVPVTGTSLLNKGSAGSAGGLLGGLLMLGLGAQLQRRRSTRR